MGEEAGASPFDSEQLLAERQGTALRIPELLNLKLIPTQFGFPKIDEQSTSTKLAPVKRDCLSREALGNRVTASNPIEWSG